MSDGQLAEMLRKLRADHGWSQTYVAERADIAQTVVSRLERGELKNPTTRVLAGLANAYSVPISSLVNAVREDGGYPEASPPPAEGKYKFVRATTPDPRPPEEDETPLESALFAVMDSKKYRAADFDAARRTIAETSRYLTEGADLEQLARNILDAASVLRREGKPANTASILARVVSGPTIGTEPAPASVNRAADPEVDASLRAKGLEPGAAATKLQERLARARKR